MGDSMDYIVKTKDNTELLIEKEHNFGNEIMQQLLAERKRQKKTQQDIADATGMKQANITRIERPDYTPSINVIQKYAEALVKKVVIEIVDDDR